MYDATQWDISLGVVVYLHMPQIVRFNEAFPWRELCSESIGIRKVLYYWRICSSYTPVHITQKVVRLCSGLRWTLCTFTHCTARLCSVLHSTAGLSSVIFHNWSMLQSHTWRLLWPRRQVLVPLDWLPINEWDSELSYFLHKINTLTSLHTLRRC